MVDMQKPLRISNFSKFVDFSPIKGCWTLVKLILWNYIVENWKDRDAEYPSFCVKARGEVIAILIRDADSFEQNAEDGVANWLDERRSMLQEYDPANRHTIPLSGGLVAWPIIIFLDHNNSSFFRSIRGR